MNALFKQKHKRIIINILQNKKGGYLIPSFFIVESPGIEPDRSDMRNDSAEILSVPVPIINKNRIFFFLNMLRYTLRARITNPRNRSIAANDASIKPFYLRLSKLQLSSLP